MIRLRLPNRRPCVTHSIDSGRFTASIGFDQSGRPRELFLSGGKPGSDLDAVLGDTAVAVSVALQSGVSAEAMALSVGRAGSPPAAISPIGIALDLIALCEREAAP